ncbi:C1 family peptidase [Sphingomonas paeninsulae]|uniref:C1 family peptidase n=1 Tax=Sphingomonas paeninsulae TaxID=2319844 RepID=UPI001EF01F35|nr:C1 family peptidase [Sphingomonas paeninsulae]
MAFAASDAHAALRPEWTPLSCEFVFYHAQRRANRSPVQGATLGSILEALRHDGQPPEVGWPYLSDLPSDHADWLPPSDLSPIFRRGGIPSSNILATVIQKLDQQEPVILLKTLSASFFVPTLTGIVDPALDEVPEPTLRHATVAVGHGTIDGSTAILIRNSWGSSWGINGHAWLTERFLNPRLFATASLKEDINVSADPVTA